MQAIVVVWLFAGLRWSELHRLDRDCVRWEYSLLEAGEDGVQPAICYLTVPVNKYKPEFRNPLPVKSEKRLNHGWPSDPISRESLTQRPSTGTISCSACAGALLGRASFAA